MRWTFLVCAKACVKGRGLGKGKQSDHRLAEAWRIAPKCYIYIRKIHFFGGRFLIGFLIGFLMIFSLHLDLVLKLLLEAFMT